MEGRDRARWLGWACGAWVCTALVSWAGCSEHPGCETSVTEVPTLCGPRNLPCVPMHDEIVLDSSEIGEPSIAVDATGNPSMMLFSATLGLPSQFLQRSGPDAWRTEPLPMAARLGVLSASVGVGYASDCALRALLCDGAGGVSEWCRRNQDWIQLSSLDDEVVGAEADTVAFAQDGTVHAVLYRFWEKTLGLARTSADASWSVAPFSDSSLWGAALALDVAEEPHVAYWRLRPGQDDNAQLLWLAPDGHEEHVLDWTQPNMVYGNLIRMLRIFVGPSTDEQPRGQPTILLERPGSAEHYRPLEVKLARRQGADHWSVSTVATGPSDTEDCADKAEGESCSHSGEDIYAWALLGNAQGEQRVLYSRRHFYLRYVIVPDEDFGTVLQQVGYEETGEIRIAWIDSCGHAQSDTLVPDTCVYSLNAVLDDQQRMHLALRERPCGLDGVTRIRYLSFTSEL